MLSERAIQSIIQTRLTEALGQESSALKGARISALQRYRGEPDGREREGHSQVVWRDVAESVDSVMPQLMKIFAGSEQIGQFQPHGPEDEPGAAQATDYVNWIWSSQNNGPMILHHWLKDGLLQRLGVIKVWWDRTERRRRETYRGLTTEELDALEIGEDDRVVWQQDRVETITDPISGQRMSLPVHDLAIDRVEEEGCVRIAAIPPEDFGCDPRAVCDEEMAFAFHRCRKTVSDLIEMGVPKAKALSLQPGDDDLDTEKSARRHPDQDDSFGDGEANLDPAMRSVWVAECYLKLDEDEDGIAEWRKITVAGPSSGVEILFDEEVDGHPFCSWTPFPTPHKLVGESLDDKVGDIQEVKTALMRQVLDNLYLTNNPGLGVTERVNLGDALDREIGGVVRVEDQAGPVGNHIMPITVPFTAGASLSVMEYIDQAKEMRTGVSRMTQGLDVDAINKTATGVNAVTNFSQERLALIARVFAESGLKRAFKKTLELVCKYQDKAKIVRLRNRWVPMDPRAWSDQMDFTVTVGIGTGNKDQMLAHLRAILALQVQAIQFQGGVQGPLVTLQNIHNTLSRLVENAGLKAPELFFADPAAAPPPAPPAASPPPAPDPRAMLLQAQLQIERARAQGEMQLAAMKAQAEIELEKQKAAAQIEIQRMKAEAEAALARVKAGLEHERKSAELGAEAELEAAKVALGTGDGELRSVS
ncbi:portal protein [Hypericibacter sp.]|uniref:portal protein n=1 Tax=Hypericibacter sp. TaxID=2705401 RepID=UPI003D6CCA5B